MRIRCKTHPTKTARAIVVAPSGTEYPACSDCAAGAQEAGAKKLGYRVKAIG